MSNHDIEKLYREIMQYQQLHGEDKTCLLGKARLFYAVADYEKALTALTGALSFDVHDEEVLFSIADTLEKAGDTAFACVYYARCAAEMKAKGNIDGCNQIVQSFETAPQTCQEIFNTVLSVKPKTFIYLSATDAFGKTKQRFENLSTALAAAGNRVIYVTNSALFSSDEKYTEEQLASYAIADAKSFDGITVITSLRSEDNTVNCYSKIISLLAGLYPDAVFVAATPCAYEALLPLKGKHKIFFDCVDDASDYKKAFWTSPDSYLIEQRLAALSDGILCTAASLFLRKAVVERKTDVYLSPNAVSALEMHPSIKPEIPEDLKNIPHPIIGYVGVVYSRFDRDLFYSLAKNNPDKSFVVVGKVLNDYIRPIYDNIYFLGVKSHSELYAYYRNFDIGIIPYFDTAKMSMACDPVKIHEHIACGLPTITSYMPDTAFDRPLVYHANTVQGVQKHIDDILAARPSVSQDERDLYLAENSWTARACQLMRIADGAALDREKTDAVIEKLRGKFYAVRDLHPNFGVIYGIACLDDNPADAEKYITDAANNLPTDFNLETAQVLAERKRPDNILRVKKSECVGCTACLNACPTGAVTKSCDALGFFYPAVIAEKCINCGACTKRCPILNDTPISFAKPDSGCLALQAADNIRLKASSGGVFPVLALKTLKEGGYVAGAVFDKSFGVKHIVSNKLSDINKMFESKYSESRLGNTYAAVKELLDKNETVLFSGCPCQTAGLTAFLGKNYEKLTVVSVVCHGVPSPEFYRKHIEAVAGSAENVIKVSFRDKHLLGWNSGFCVNYGKGEQYVSASGTDVYMDCFLSDLILRESCYNCRFKQDIFSDITLGDFWGIDRLGGNNDGLGVSYVSANTEKGEKLIESISGEVKSVAKYSKNAAILFNPSIRCHANVPVCKERFFDSLKKHNFDLYAAYDDAFYSVRFDAVLILWFSCNYGNALTNYALYSTLTNMGLSVLVADNILVGPRDRFAEFAKRHFNLSLDYFPAGHACPVNTCSDNFIVGSDQVWNSNFSDFVGNSGYFQLSFVPDDKNKISYGSSFGNRKNGVVKGKEEYYTALYKRFNHIAVREKFGVEVLHTLFGVNGEYVLDPIFLPDTAEYLKLAETAGKLAAEGKKYIVTYFLQPSKEKLAYTNALCKMLGDDVCVVNITDAEPAFREKNAPYFSGERIVEYSLTPEEFLKYFANSEYVVTDSYHGTCFSIIFKKRFTAFVARQSDRFETFAEFGLDDRVFGTVPDLPDEKALAAVDFTKADTLLCEMRKKSLDYLKNALNI